MGVDGTAIFEEAQSPWRYHRAMVPFAPITLGRALCVAESESFTFTETEHVPGTLLAAHAHERPAISIVASGMRTYRFGVAAFDCGPASALFVPAGAPHASSFGAEGGHGFMIELRRRPDVFTEPRALGDGDLARCCDAIRRELWFPDDVTPLALESLAFELLPAAEREAGDSRRAPLWLERVRERVHHSFPMRLSLERIAGEAGVERSRLTRAFRRHFRTSIAAYVRAIRIRRAWELVACGDMPLGEIAFECGFTDQSHLTRAFRRAYATTPGVLRAYKTRRRAVRTLRGCAPS